MNAPHEALLDDVALYALGVLDAANAQHVREHMTTCEQCRAEYEALSFAPQALARSQEAAPSDLLKARIMRDVRASAAPAPTTAPERSKRSINAAIPAYLLAAACLVIAVVTSLGMWRTMNVLRDAQGQLAVSTGQRAKLEQELHAERLEVADLASNNAVRIAVSHGSLVRSHNRLYLALHELHAPAAGHVYQAWTLPRGQKEMEPSVTFTPDRNGDALVPIPAEADMTSAVAVSVEPDGGSRAPTTKPILVTTVD